jgi:hypothetical protein
MVDVGGFLFLFLRGGFNEISHFRFPDYRTMMDMAGLWAWGVGWGGTQW